MITPNAAAQRLENIFVWACKNVPVQHDPGVFKILTNKGGLLFGYKVAPARKRSEASKTDEVDGEDLLPALDIYAQSVKRHPELDGEWTGVLIFKLRVQADESTPEGLSAAADGITALMDIVNELQGYLNFPYVKRPDPNFMIQDVTHQDFLATNEGREYVESIAYQIQFRNDNGQG